MRHLRIAIELLLTSTYVVACRPARSGPGFATSTLANEVVPLMQRYNVPHVGIAIVRGSDVVVDTILSLDGAVRSDARFEAASLSKPVFASIVMMLARDGRIDLDAPLAKYPGWPRLGDPRAASISARMVLSHSAGLGNAADNPAQRLAFAPGGGWRYSGEGYRYLQRVVETMTRQPLDALAHRLVFDQLGMGHSTFVDPDTAEPSWLRGHDRAGRILPNRRFSKASAATTLRTTVTDYARFVEMFLGDPMNNGEPLEALQIDAMLHPTVVVDSSLALSWGLGWAIADSVAFHWGSNPGFKNFVLVDRERHFGIVMLTDADNGLELAPTVVEAATGRRYKFFQFYMLHPND